MNTLSPPTVMDADQLASVVTFPGCDRTDILRSTQVFSYKQRLLLRFECGASRANCGMISPCVALVPVNEIGTPQQLSSLRKGGICEPVLLLSGATALDPTVQPQSA